MDNNISVIIPSYNEKENITGIKGQMMGFLSIVLLSDKVRMEDA